ncbi:MAG: PrsW family glutamic-type intramembrane protease [Patescibacteria group bacterium]
MAANLTISTLLFAIAGGFLPSLLWLWFWLKEDNHPEPFFALISAFVSGMIAVPLAIFLEYLVSFPLGLTGGLSLFVWAFIEEILKYLAMKKNSFCKKCFDEPIDAIVYMITTALGFASLENTLFIIKTFNDNGILSGINIGNMRFLGATLLHTASSAIVGAFIAFSMRKKKKKLTRNTIIGIILAGLLHFAFNYIIMRSDGGNILKVLMPLWFVIIVLIFVFEKVKGNIK